MTARHAVLSIGALVVLGLGVYLLVEVRAQPAEIVGTSPPVAAPERAAPAAQPVAAPREAARAPAPTPAAPAPASAPPSWLPARPAAPGPALAAGDPADPGSDLDPLAGPRLDAVMAEANKAYDRGDFDDAKTIAARVLAREPSNIRMLRVMVSASCVDGDSTAAQTHYARLPAADQAQMRTRCARYGIAFPDKP